MVSQAMTAATWILRVTYIILQNMEPYHQFQKPFIVLMCVVVPSLNDRDWWIQDERLHPTIYIRRKRHELPCNLGKSGLSSNMSRGQTHNVAKIMPINMAPRLGFNRNQDNSDERLNVPTYYQERREEQTCRNLHDQRFWIKESV